MTNRISAAPLVLLAAVAHLGGCRNEPLTTEAATLHIQLVQGPSPKGLPGLPLVDSIVIRVMDEGGEPRSQVLVQWSPRGAGSTSPVQSVTNRDGLAAVHWTLGPAEGVQSLQVTAEDNEPLMVETEAQYFKPSVFSAGEGIGCGIVDGDIWCWGKGFRLRPTPWSVTPTEIPEGNAVYPRPGRVTNSGDFVDVVSRGFHGLCGLQQGGTLTCWNGGGVASAPASIPLWGLTANVASGQVCGLAVADSTPWCMDQVQTFAQLHTTRFTEIAAARTDRGCGLLVDSTAMCWGAGYLGNGTTAGSTLPVAVDGAHRFIDLSNGGDLSCGRTVGRELWCWGNNNDGLLGSAPALSPVLVASGVSSASAFGRLILVVQGGRAVRFAGGGWPPRGTPSSLVSALVGDVSRGNVGCVQLLDGQLRCWEDMHVNYSGFLFENYIPVQPAGD